MKKYFYKISLLLSGLFSNNLVYANEDFFSDYKGTNTDITLITPGTSQQLANTFGFGYDIIKWIWIFLFSLTIISVIVSLVRLAILADDVPIKKANAKHDLAASLVILAILGGVPVIFNTIVWLLNLLK